jgi:heptaprenyl diphosphate synthase
MDDAPTRRGVPTAQHIWGNSVAILTGDLLFARASQVGANLGQASLNLQADTFERLCLGQLHETVGPGEGEEPMRVFGEKVGVAFQLIDDVIDISEAGPSGKTPGTDLRAGVPTMPVLLLRKAAAAGDKSAADLLTLIDGDLTEDSVLAYVVKRLREHAVAEQAYNEAKRWADEAVEAIQVLPAGSIREALTLFAQAVVDRQQ